MNENTATQKETILFICIGNSVRSQMAEGLMKKLSGDRFEVFSAGSNPAYVHPRTIKVMAEAGIDISHHWSKPFSEFEEKKIDYVISLCEVASLSCPTFPGQKDHIKWHVEDPIRVMGDEERKLFAFRFTRDSIKNKILHFLKEHNP